MDNQQQAPAQPRRSPAVSAGAPPRRPQPAPQPAPQPVSPSAARQAASASESATDQWLDGPTLRAIREGLQLPLRRIARTAGLSHGHLSKVERGEHGRPITPTVLAAYERVAGVSLRQALAQADPEHPLRSRGRQWHPGEFSRMRRMAYNAQLGSVTMGGQLGETLGRMVDRAGRATAPASLQPADLAQCELLVQHLAALDARFGGRWVTSVAKTQLQLLSPHLSPVEDTTDTGNERLHRVFGTLAGRAAWAAFDAGWHESARVLFPLALWCAIRGGDTDLRAHVAADAAAQHVYLGYVEDALQVLHLVEADDRVAPGVRMVVHGVKARAYAAAGDAARCRRQVAHAEQAFADTDHQTDHDGAADRGRTGQGWATALRTASRLEAATGHALAVLGRHTGHAEDLDQARQRLTRAIDGLDPVWQARARVLCQTQLAGLLAHLGERDHAAAWATQARHDADGIGSARVEAALRQLQKQIPHDGGGNSAADEPDSGDQAPPRSQADRQPVS